MIVPLLKWAGGKRWLATAKGFRKPATFQRYVEPFVGGGALFFQLEPRTAVLSDLNEDLINFYKVLRDRPLALERAMLVHQAAHSTSYYYEVRDTRPTSKLDRASRFLYLNRTCWNGLYRVNRKGEFNVPIGTKQAVLMDTDDFAGAARALRRADIRCADFEDVVDGCGLGDFLFVDPPYTAKHNLNGFLKYNEDIFKWDDQLRLHAALQAAAGRGAQVCVTNADHASLRSLYSDFDLTVLERNSILAGKAGARGATTEAMFTINI